MASSISAPVLLRPSLLKSEQPLLPPVLLGPAAFLWLWALPVGVLLLLNLQGFRLIEGNMDASQRATALCLGACNLVDLLAAFAFFFATWSLRKRGNAPGAQHPAWALCTILFQAGYLWYAMASMGNILPRNVVAWLYPETRFMFNQFAFVMLPLFLGILRLSGAPTIRGCTKSLRINLALVIAGPVLLFAAFHAFRLFGFWPRMAGISAVTITIVLGIVMVVGLCRAVLLFLRATRDWGAKGERAAIVVFALALPVAGLWLNRSIPFPVDLQAWEVYALVIANAAVLLLTSYQHARRPLLSFYLLCGTLPFSLYFFLVFLPYTPLSILAVIVMGAGFLVLAPILLFVLHLHLLKETWLSPLLIDCPRRALAGGLVCLLLLPGFFTVRGLADKAALNAALDYIYTPVIKTSATAYPGSRLNLARALRNHRSYKNGIFYPLLSEYYSWLVFDDLILPDDKLAHLETVFFGKVGAPESADPFRSPAGGWRSRTVRDRSLMPRPLAPTRTVEISQMTVQVTAAGEHASTATLALTLKNTGQSPAEYVKALPLPAGIFVSGFRLQVNGTMVPGRVVEKKTALWVYSMIRDSERRDPGLLYYKNSDELELRVFPVAPAGETRVEMDFLLPAGPNELHWENTQDPAEILQELSHHLSPQQADSAAGAFLAGGLEDLALPPVERETYLHLIVDRSEENGYVGDFSTALRTLKERFPSVHQLRVTLANYNVVDCVNSLTGWDNLPSGTPAEWNKALPLSGGFAVDSALAHVLRQHCESDLDQPSHSAPPPRPIYLILSKKAVARPLELPLAEAWAHLSGDLNIQELDTEGTLVVHRSRNLSSAFPPLLRLGNSVRPLFPSHPVYFSTSGGRDDIVCYWDPSTARWQPLPGGTPPVSVSRWTAAAALQNSQQKYSRSPGEGQSGLRQLVNASRQSGILLPTTSYIVVENSAQWRILELSEDKKLAQNAALGFREADAPPLLYVALGFGGWVILRRICRRRGRPFAMLTAS